MASPTYDYQKQIVDESGNVIGTATHPLISSDEPAKGTRTFSTAAPTNSAAQALAANTSRKEALIYNNGTMTVYLGKDNTVTTSNGLPLAPGATLRDDRATGAWWAIVASGTGDLRIVEVA